MNKTAIIVLVLLIVIIGGYLILKSPEVQAPIEETSQTEEEVTLEENTQAPVVEIETEVDASLQLEPVIVVYSDIGYSPSPLTIKAGTTVTFKNESTMSMWTASASHPTHAVYPTTGGCLGSTFDACKGVQPGESWSFKFDEVGSWGYHDHLTPKFTGRVVVE